MESKEKVVPQDRDLIFVSNYQIPTVSHGYWRVAGRRLRRVRSVSMIQICVRRILEAILENPGRIARGERTLGRPPAGASYSVHGYKMNDKKT